MQQADQKQRGSRLGLYGYLAFVISWFLHVPERIPVLGVLRVDLLLVAFLAWLSWSNRDPSRSPMPTIERRLWLLVGFAVLMIPFAEWPGSVVKSGFPELIKAVVFYYFTVAFVRSEDDLKKFVWTFMGCQIFRVLEPLYLHVTSGYWGSGASELGGREFLARLSGSPSDVVNPNGLAYVCCTVLLFLYFFRQTGRKQLLAFLLLWPAVLYALALTGSRSGAIGLAVILVGIAVKSRRVVAMTASVAVVAVVAFPLLSPDMQDRYLSIIGRGTKNEATAGERWAGLEAQWTVARRRLLTGYGLGTSPEANFNFTTSGPYVGLAMPAHNLYMEALQELGIFGLAIVVAFMVAVVTSFFRASWRSNSQSTGPPDLFMRRLLDTMQVWLVMGLVESFASYGLYSYEWYLFAGLSMVMQRIRSEQISEVARSGATAPRGVDRLALTRAAGARGGGRGGAQDHGG
ncbi:MAG: O-antigen ligase family protein [Steroidobacteraceae bacterium]